MANEVTTTVGAALIPSQVVDEAIFGAAYDDDIDLRAFVKFLSLVGAPGEVVKVPKYPKLTAVDQTQGTDMANTAFAPTSVNITADEAGLMITLLDAFVNADVLGDGVAVYFGELGKAVREKINTDIMAEAADLSTSVGTTTADFTVAQFLSGLYELLNGKAPGPYAFIGHPIQKHDIRAAIVTSASAIWGAGSGPESLAAMPGRPEVLFGVLCLETITAASVNADADRQGFMGPMGAACGLVYLEKYAPRVELERNASLRGTELVASAYYGDECCNIAANGGIKVVTDKE
jgi:hypothetical protein